MKEQCIGILLFLCTICAETPFQIRLSLTGRPDERVVMWTSAVNSPGSVMYWEETEPGIVLQDSSFISTYSYPGFTIPYFHTATMRNLAPFTKYIYRVETNGSWSVNNLTFTTENYSSDVRILMMGDMSTSSAAHDVVNRISTLKSQYNFDFVLYAGDLSYANGDQTYWNTWQTMIQDLTGDLPWMFSVGNHENENGGFTAFQTRFSMPANSSNALEGNLYYSFNYENVHVIALNSEASSFSSGTPMRIWLENDLAMINRTQTPWVFATWHKPWYCSNQAHAGEGESMRIQLEPVLYQYGVDLVLNGHVHAYERTTTTYNYTPTSDGIVYLNVGSAGQNLHTTWVNPADSWSVYRNATHGVGMMTIYNDTHIYWEFITPEGSIEDSTWIRKSTVVPSPSPTPTPSRTPTTTPSVTPSVGSSSSPSQTPSVLPTSTPNSSPSNSTGSSSGNNDKEDKRGWILFGVVLTLSGLAFGAIIVTVCLKNSKNRKEQVQLPELNSKGRLL